MIQQRRRITPLKRLSPGERITARRLNEPVDAINRLAAGVKPARQVVFKQGGGGRPKVTGPWLCTDDPIYPINQVIVELDPTTMYLKLGRLVVGSYWSPEGVGGDGTVIWQLEKAIDVIRKFDPVTMAMVEFGRYPFVTLRDLGGSATALWVLDGERIYRLAVELDATHRYPLAPDVPNTFPLPAGASADPVGVGGDGTVIWYVDGQEKRIHRLNANGQGETTSWPAPPLNPPEGDVYTPAAIGGNVNAVYYACRLTATRDTSIWVDEDNVYRLYHLDPNDDMRIVAEALYYGLLITGIGG